MARKAFISSDMAHDEKLFDLAEENPTAVMMWPWLVTYLDDWGRALASPKRIKSQLFPNIPTITVAAIHEAIEAYGRVGLVELYTDGEHQYMAIPTSKWFKWQTHIRSEKRDKDRSKYPPCPSDCAQVREDARDCAQVSADRDPSPSLTPSPTPTPSSDKEQGDQNIQGALDGAAATSERDSSLLSDIDPELVHVAKVYQESGFGIASQLDQQLILELVTEYGTEWMLLAIKEAVMQNKRRLKYVRSILQNWRADGGPRTGDTRAPTTRQASAVQPERKPWEVQTNDPRYESFNRLFESG